MGKIIMCCPFFNEGLISKLNIQEASNWVDEIHITEFNKSFKYGDHQYCFDMNLKSDKVFYHQMDANKLYKKPRKYVPYFFIKPISKWMKHYCRRTAWYNDGVSRNYSLWNSNYSDDDILILSDIDEIIDSKYANEIVDLVRKNGIVTIELYFTLFYFNLWCPQFSGPKNYSYRIFVVRGDVMRNRFYNDSDYLRKMGESGKLQGKVLCMKGIKGFHHSWLGDEDFVVNKFNSWAHTIDDGFDELRDSNGNLEPKKLKEHLKKGKSIFADYECVVNNDIPFIEGIQSLRDTNPEYFL